MRVVSLWNPKGGQGKSLYAINLAAAACEEGLTPLVICQDPQGTSTTYFQEGNLPFTVLTDVPEKPPEGVDVVFLDHQASDWGIPAPKFVVMPVRPMRDQFTTYIKAKVLAEKEGKQIFTIVTDVNSHRPEERETAKALKESGAFVIPSSGVFSRAASEYRTIFDSALNGAYKVRDRRNEIKNILNKIMEA